MATQYFTSDAGSNVINEDVQDLLSVIGNTLVPLYSRLPKVSVDSHQPKWVERALASNAAIAIAQGASFSDSTTVEPATKFNYTQIIQKVINIADTRTAAKHNAMASFLATELDVRMKELLKAIEYNMAGVQNVRVAPSAGSTAGEMSTFSTWTATNSSVGSTGSLPTGDGSDNPGDGTNRALTEALIETAVASCWDNGGMPDLLCSGSFNIQQMTSFSGRGSVSYDAPVNEKAIHNRVDIYHSQFGSMEIVPSPNVLADAMLILERDQWAVGELRPVEVIDIAKTSDATRKALQAEVTLIAYNEESSATIYDLTTS